MELSMIIDCCMLVLLLCPADELSRTSYWLLWSCWRFSIFM